MYTKAMATFVKAVKLEELAEKTRLCLTINDWPLVLIKTPTQIHALLNVCSHQNSPIGDGRIKRGTIMCPLHGARFKLDTGENIGGQYPAIQTFETQVANNWVEIAVPQETYEPITASASGF